MHQRARPAGPEKALRVQCFCRALHAGASAGCPHGFSRRGLRRLLPVSPPQRRRARRRARMSIFSCALPLTTTETVLLGHGSGGKLSADLLRSIFLPALTNPVL